MPTNIQLRLAKNQTPVEVPINDPTSREEIRGAIQAAVNQRTTTPLPGVILTQAVNQIFASLSAHRAGSAAPLLDLTQFGFRPVLVEPKNALSATRLPLTNKETPELPKEVVAAATTTADHTAVITQLGATSKHARLFIDHIAPLLARSGARVTFADPTQDHHMQTGAYFNADTNTIVIDQNASPNDILDQCLFEAHNALNARRLAEIERDYSNSRLTPMEYGQLVAETEFDAARAYVDAYLPLQKAAGEHLTDRARRTVEFFAQSGDLKQRFCNTPHDPEGIGRAQLSTAELYAYERIEGTSHLRITGLVGAALRGQLDASAEVSAAPEGFNDFREWIIKEWPSSNAAPARPEVYQQALERARKAFPKQAHLLGKDFDLTPQMLALARNSAPRSGENI